MRHERVRYRLRDWSSHGFSLGLSDDGSKALATWRVDNELHGILDGKRLEPVVWRPGESPRWKRHPLSMAKTEVVERRGKQFLLAGDWEYGPYDEVKDVVESNFGLAFAARQKQTWCVVAGDHEYGAFQRVQIEQVLENGEPAFWGRRADRGSLVLGQDVVGPFSNVYTYETHPKTQQVLLCYKLGKSEQVALGDELLLELQNPDYVQSLSNAFSPDGKHVAFPYQRASTGGGFYVDGKHYEGYNYTDGPWWSTSGRLAWAHDSDTSELVIDGEFRKLPYPVRWESGSEFGFAPDGGFVIVMFDRKHDHVYLMVGDQLHGPFSSVKTVRKNSHDNLPTRFHAVLFARKGYAFGYSLRDKKGSFVHWRGKELGPFEHLNLTVSNERLILAHLDADHVVVEEHT